MTFESPDRIYTEGERFPCIFCGMFTWGDPRREVNEGSHTFICEGCTLPNAVRAREREALPELIAAPVIRLVPKTESQSEELPREQVA
jgi:hypothetical protein